jgi:hypothetical protein
VHGISLIEQEFCQVRSVLAGNAGDECFFHIILFLFLKI